MRSPSGQKWGPQGPVHQGEELRLTSLYSVWVATEIQQAQLNVNFDSFRDRLILNKSMRGFSRIQI